MKSLRSNELINRAMLILGAYAFSIPVVSLIHEFGHILAMMSVGINQYTLVINPFTESSATPWVSLPAESLLFISASGMIFQTIVFSILGLVLWRSRSVLMFPLMMCVPMSMINVGSYLLMGAIVEGSDVVLMAEAGIPPIVIQLIGLIFLSLGIWTFTRLLPVAGFRKTDSTVKIFASILLGTGTYSLAMLVYGYLSGYGTMIGAINIVASLITGLIYTVILKRSKSNEVSNPSLMESIKVLGIGLTAIALCLVIW